MLLVNSKNVKVYELNIKIIDLEKIIDLLDKEIIFGKLFKKIVFLLVNFDGDID